MLKAWTAELGCGSSHQVAPAVLRALDSGEWERLVAEDVAARQGREIDQATG
jgi:hypothetical protein